MNEEQSLVCINDLFTIAGDLIRKHDITNAVNKLLEAVELEPGNTIFRNLLGTCYLRLGEHSRAASCWEEVMAIDPENKTAKKSLKSYHSPGNQFWIKRYEDALFEMEKKNFENAKAILHKLFEENDGQVKIYQLLGLCHLATNDLKNAELVWQKGLTLDKSNPQLLEYLASIKERKAGNIINMKNISQETVTNKPVFMRKKLIWAVSGVLVFTLATQAGMYIKNRQLNFNQTGEQRTITGENGDKRAVPVIAAVDNQKKEAKNTVNKENDAGMAGAAYDVDREGYYYWAGRQNYLDHDWKNAVNNFRVVADMQTYSYLHREALYYMARCQYLGGNLTEAEQNYLKFLKSFPNSNYYDDSLFYLGCIYYRQKNLVKAAEMLSKLQEVDPQSGYLSTDIFHQVMSKK